MPIIKKKSNVCNILKNSIKYHNRKQYRKEALCKRNYNFIAVVQGYSVFHFFKMAKLNITNKNHVQ